MKIIKKTSMNSSSAAFPLALLPNEILLAVLQFLNFKDLLKFSMTNKFYQEFTATFDQYLWGILLRIYFPHKCESIPVKMTYAKFFRHLITRKAYKDFSAIHFELFRIAYFGDAKKLEQLADQLQLSDFKIKNDVGYTVLQVASYYKNQAFLDSATKIIRTQFLQSTNSFYVSDVVLLIACNQVSTLSQLFKKSPAYLEMPNQGLFPIHLTVLSFNIVPFDLICDLDPEALSRTARNKTAIDLAIERNNLEILERCYLRNQNIFTVLNQKGQTALHQAAFLGKIDIVTFLIEKNVAVNAQDDFGDTPLHSVIASKSPNYIKILIIELLVKSGADLFLENNDEQQTPFEFAIDKNCAVMLLEAVADILLNLAQKEPNCYKKNCLRLFDSILKKPIRAHVEQIVSSRYNSLKYSVDFIRNSESFFPPLDTKEWKPPKRKAAEIVETEYEERPTKHSSSFNT